jgi:nitrile hydratase subunit beta
VNGVHDVGGMHNFGPVEREENEPVFHQRWEARIFALRQAMKPWRKWSMDTFRYQRTMISPADYLSVSYYEQFLVTLEALLVKTGLATREEIETGKPAPGSPKASPALTAGQVPAMIAKGNPSRRDVAVAPRFQAGQVVRARNMHPAGHTRLPRYARGKQGVIERDYGVFVFPDTNAENLGEKPQHVYAVRFAARELWGEQASARDAVYIDLWDDYLEPA